MRNDSIYQPTSIIDLIRKNGKPITFQRNEYIYLPGDEATTIFLIDYGEVFIGKMQEEGRALIYKLLNAGNIFGATKVFALSRIYSSYAKAKTECRIYALEWSVFKEYYNNHEDIRNQWVEYLEIESQRYATKMRDLFMHGKIGALAGTLIRLQNSYGVMTSEGILIDTQLTNQEIANMCGTTREGINRLLSELKELSIITVKKKKIIIHDIEKLRQIIQCESCDVEYCQVF